MTDQQDLYFLSLLAQAYDAPDPKKAIARALEQIHTLGIQPEYQEGYRNFQAFLHEILTNSGLVADLAEDILHKIETGDLEDIPDDQLNALLEMVQGESIPSLETTDPTLCELTLQATDGQRWEIQLHPGEPHDIQKTTPGEYTLTFADGREIWTGNIEPAHLIWSLAYPGESLPAAAAIQPAELKPTFTTHLLGGEILLETFPGIENGTLRLWWNK
jgi:hypothetical protein